MTMQTKMDGFPQETIEKPELAVIPLPCNGNLSLGQTEKGENRMKITLDIPDGMRCAYLCGVVDDLDGYLKMSCYMMESNDLHNGAEIKLPREAKPDEK